MQQQLQRAATLPLLLLRTLSGLQRLSVSWRRREPLLLLLLLCPLSGLQRLSVSWRRCEQLLLRPLPPAQPAQGSTRPGCRRNSLQHRRR